jgi:hypothetical protein
MSEAVVTRSAQKRAAKRREADKAVVLSNGDVRLVCVPKSQVWMLSSSVWDMLKPALERQHHMTSIDRLRKDCASGNSQLWFVTPEDTLQVLAIAVTEVLQYPGKRMFCIGWLGGSQMRRWIDFFEVFVDLAKRQGCDGIEVHGRRGWERVLSRWGLSFDRLVVSRHFAR